jgi:Fe-S-cluster containining protein
VDNKAMKQVNQIISEVSGIYQWLEGELAKLSQSCDACGKCCDFESFGHRLYVTTPELMYFRYYLGPEIKEMATGVCPYRIDGKCTVYPYRFAGCRIFTCKGDTEKENQICEEAVRRFKALCNEYGLDYHYVYLQTGLEMLKENPKRRTTN